MATPPGADIPVNERIAAILSRASSVLAIAVALVGAVHLAAWLLGWMQRPASDTLTMKVNAAFCLVLSGVALALSTRAGPVKPARRTARLLALVALLIGLATLAENRFGWDLGIDQLLATEFPGALGVSAPNRMGTPASIGFILVGLALVVLGRARLERRAVFVVQGLGAAVSLIASLGVIGYLYDASPLYEIATLTGIAWPTAVSLLALGIGLLCARPREGMMRFAVADDGGGRTLRPLLGLSLGLPLVVGYLRLLAERRGLFDAAIGTALVMLLFMVVLTGVIWFSARVLSRREAAGREAQEAVRASEERYRDLVETSPDGVFVNCEDRIVFANPAAVRLFGAQRAEQVLGGRPQDRFTPEYHPVMAERIRRVLDGERTPLIETRLVRLDGTERHVEVAAGPTTHQGRRAVQVVLRDISDRKQAEAALRDSEAELRELNRVLENRVRERTADLDQANHTLRLISVCNEVLVRVTDEQELMRRVCEIITTIGGYRMAWVGLAEDDGRRSVRPVASVGFEDGYLERARITWADDDRGRGPTGTCIRLGDIRVSRDFLTDPELEPWRAEALRRGYRSSIALPLKNAGKVFGALTLYSEEPRAFGDGQVAQLSELADDLAFGISALRIQRERDHALEVAERHAEQLRLLAVQLTQAEQKERQRLARVLHDHIQQLLVAARMQVELALRKQGDASQPALLDGAVSILRESIDASRSLAVELSPPALQGSGLAGGLGWLASMMKEKHRFEIALDVGPDAEPATEDVRFLVFECVRELLLNAVKHSGVSGASVSLRRGPDRRIHVTVADRGNGFDGVRALSQGMEEATFGLFSIQQRMAHIGGRMEIDSAVGRGTVIRLEVPSGEASESRGGADGAPAGRAVPDRPPDGEPAPIRVLLVDDHRIVRQGLAGLLRLDPGFQVVGEAENGPEAILQAALLNPDVVVMDVNLGDMSGIEATRAILSKLPRVRVIGLSMHVDPGSARAMLEAGAVSYLTKGGPTEDLVAAIRSCASRDGASASS